MSMYDAIKKFPEQFLFEPKVENEKKLKKHKFYTLCGMGGSHLQADLLKMVNLNLFVYANYGLPPFPEEIVKKGLFIASSYSGNTEEPIDSYHQIKKTKIPLAAITIGGELLDLAKKDKIPYVQVPNTGIQPRSATGYMLKALLAVMKDEKSLAETTKLAQSLDPAAAENHGKKMANELFGRVPVIYASEANRAIAQNWKIKFNETAKIPAFYNVFPELNHNEMTGFDVKEKTHDLSERIYFIFLHDKTDHPQIQNRMKVTKKLYQQRDFPVIDVTLQGENTFHKIFSSLMLADFTAYFTANLYDSESEAVPMVEEFKKLI